MTMMDLSNGPLRDWLRVQTRARHDRVDAVFSGLCEGGLRGRARFLTAQAIAAPGLAAAVHAQKSLPFAADFDPTPAAGLLAADLSDLGHAAPAPARPTGVDTRDAAIGAAYTLAGSRLGARVLDREWRASAPHPFASRYLSADRLFGDWRGFCANLASIGEDAADASAILAGALAAFDHFETAAQAALEFLPVDD